jgi:hypothetical protein
MGIVIKICSILWSLAGAILLALSVSVVARTQELVNFRLYSLATVIIIFALSVFMYFVSLKIQKRKKYRRLHSSLMFMLPKQKYKVSLARFAEKNEVEFEFAQKYVDSILKHFHGRLDINDNGMIMYK